MIWITLCLCNQTSNFFVINDCICICVSIGCTHFVITCLYTLNVLILLEKLKGLYVFSISSFTSSPTDKYKLEKKTRRSFYHMRLFPGRHTEWNVPDQKIFFTLVVLKDLMNELECFPWVSKTKLKILVPFWPK